MPQRFTFMSFSRELRKRKLISIDDESHDNIEIQSSKKILKEKVNFKKIGKAEFFLKVIYFKFGFNFFATSFGANLQSQECVIYPKNSIDSVTLTESDLKRLDDGNYLNDNIIDFYLKYLRHEALISELRDKFYFFNCYFYSTLTQENGLERVKKWTKNVNLFNYQYIFIPIHQKYVLSVCYHTCPQSGTEHTILLYSTLVTESTGGLPSCVLLEVSSSATTRPKNWRAVEGSRLLLTADVIVGRGVPADASGAPATFLYFTL